MMSNLYLTNAVPLNKGNGRFIIKGITANINKDVPYILKASKK